MANVLVLTGSPRVGGNSDLLADAFIRGAEAAGHKVGKFRAGTRQINGCIACETCWKTGRACSIQDDFADLEPLLEAADVIVFASPLYFFGLPAQLKACIDKLYAYRPVRTQRELHIDRAYLLMTAADQLPAYDGVIKSIELVLHYLAWENAGMLLVPGMSAKGDIQRTDALGKAEELGRNL